MISKSRTLFILARMGDHNKENFMINLQDMYKETHTQTHTHTHTLHTHMFQIRRSEIHPLNMLDSSTPLHPNLQSW